MPGESVTFSGCPVRNRRHVVEADPSTLWTRAQGPGELPPWLTEPGRQTSTVWGAQDFTSDAVD